MIISITAGLLSLMYPGLGHLIKLHVITGILYMLMYPVVVLVLLFTTGFTAILLLPFIHLYAGYSAYRI